MPRPSGLRSATLVFVLAASSALSVILVLLRIAYSDNITYIFLNWNLFLAWIPFVCAAAAVLLQGSARSPRLAIVPLLALWLLFLPNAPYILTDFLHLTPRDNVPLWYDILLLFTYAWNGLILGFASLWMVQGIVRRAYGALAGWAMATVSLVACAAGVYLGRFERWNSWDLLFQPVPLLRTMLRAALDPSQHVRAIVIVMLLAAVLCMMYFSLALFAADERREPSRATVRS